MLQSGSGLPPGSPVQGQGVRQADSQTLCLPRRRSDGYTAPFPLIGEIPPVSVLLLSPQRPFAFAGAPFIGLGIKVPQKIPPNWGQQWLISLGWGYSLPLPEKSTNPPLRLQRWLTGAFCALAVPQGTQGTQDSGGGFLRHLRHFRHWSVYCTSTSRCPLLR